MPAPAHLAGTLLLEQNDEWAVGYLRLETFAAFGHSDQLRPAAAALSRQLLPEIR